MRHTAYLVIFVENGTGAFKGAGVFSESGSSLTMDHWRLLAATAMEVSAGTYQEARDSLMENIRTWKPLQWLIPHIEKRGVYR